MNTDFINALKLAGMGMAAIFLVILVIYLFVHMILKIPGRKKKA
jgi:preprotein translocase subunit Sss1